MGIGEVRPLRRLYSTFAGGWPGIGLILMRLVVGVALVDGAGSALRSLPSVPMAIVAALLAGAAILLVAGLFTPLAGTLAALMESCRLVTLPSDWLVYLLLAASCAALAMLGPGLWSVDARLFGWKRIEPSPRKR